MFAVAESVTAVLCFVLRLPCGLRLAFVTIAIVRLIAHIGRVGAPALKRFLEVSFEILVVLLEGEFV